ncbi:MAG: hypothetical protein DRP08_02850, partial [Candidatus Aenigmatarchaeota archaeon]
MYLIQPGDEITFSVTANEACNFTWEVNKVEEKNTTSPSTTNSFTFTVPSLSCSQDPSKCIWEIHVKAYNDNGEAHHEWVISTLNESEAPDIFDYFTDKKYQSRTETDPWGRALPEWSGSFSGETSECSVKAGYVDISYHSSITEGTWIFRYKYKYPQTTQSGAHVTFYPIYSNKLSYRWNKNPDAHHHCVIESWLHGERTQFSMDYDGVGLYEDGEWHKVVLIRKGNYFYAFREIKHQSLAESKMMLEFHAYEPLDNISEIRIYMRDMGNPNKPYIDDIQVYENKYLFPYNGNIYIGNYFYDHWDNGEGLAPLWKEGIIVQGRNNTLKDIAEAINDPSIFYYDEKTKTAICYKDLVLDEGAELIIKDETLKFHSTYDGELSFVLDYGSRLYVENSTITSDTQYYWVWNNAGSTTHWSNEIRMYDYRKTEPSYGPPRWSGHFPLEVAYHGEFIIKNSTIDNFAHLFLDSPYEVNITDSKFTNIHEIDIGLYNPVGGGWLLPINFCKGNKSIWIYTDDVNINDFTIKNVIFSGAEHPLNFTFLLNAHRDKYNIYDMNAEDNYIVIKESMAENKPQSHSCYVGGSSGPWGGIYPYDSYIASELGLVNCKFRDILITPGIFTDHAGRKKQKAAYVKYYLDVKVVDKDGNPIENANVSVNVEQDWTLDDMKTNHYPVENMVVEKPYAVGNYNCYYHHYRWVDGQPLNHTYTTATGHTPLPSEDPAHTLIIVDYKKYRDIDTEEVKQENYTYTITASYNGKTASLSGLDIDESWYREDPNVPTKTIVCNIDTGNCWIEGVATGTLKGKVTDKETGLPIVGATVTANSHQTTTNSSGDYIITNLLPGNYTVTASKAGYYSSTATAEILANQTTTLNFQLTKDTTPPVISNITISSITTHSAVISWKTNESSTSLVKYGISPGNYPYSKEDTSYTAYHSITLTGLSPNTTYYFVVNSTDKANNSAQSTEHSFKTKELSNIVYVARDGTGDYNCDGEDDQIEINQAIAYINSIGGGTVHLKNGTFVISDSINLTSNLIFEGEDTEKTTIKIEDGSTKENWATIVGDGISSTIVRNLTINGNKYNTNPPQKINSDVDAIRLYYSSNITVENVKMIDFWTDGVEFSHSGNSVVKDCEVIQAGHEGLRAIYSDNITFSNNYVYSEGTGNAGIRIYESSNCIIENNYFNVYGFGILINPQGGVPCGNNIYRGNYIEGHYGLPGIALWPWDTEVSNETFIRNIIAKTDGTQEPYGHGIHLRTRGTASLKNIKIINNVINNAIKSGIYVEDGADVSNIVAKNNIIVNNGEYGIYGNVLSSYNDVWNNNAGNYGGGASAGKGDISADPLFASPPHDFHLKSQAGRWNGSAWVKDDITSPCIDAGVPFEEDPVYGDYRNELPPNGSRINMGAYGNTK